MPTNPIPFATRLIVVLAVAFLSVWSAGCSSPSERTASDSASFADTIRVVVAAYYPAQGTMIDRTKTGDWGESVEFTRNKVDSVTTALKRALEEGSRYHAYEDASAKPSLIYEIVDRQEFMQPLPTVERAGSSVPMTDYGAIFDQVGGETWVQENGVDEFWVWGYHGGVLDLWESNMSSPYGDISNSDRNPDDLPILGSTYTMYHYNYQRGAAEAVENHMHQLEAVINFIDGRDTTAAADWPSLLFWGKFVGSDSTHKLLNPRRAGWSHYPPNAEHDYQWANPDPVISDIENWNPDEFVSGQPIECSKWNCKHLDWFVYWMQNIPGAQNGLTYNGQPIRNWWTLMSQYDEARAENWKLWVED